MLLYNELQFFCRIPLLVALIVFYRFTGLAFTDIKHLRPEHITKDPNGENWIRKPREKTNNMCHIPLLDIPALIAEKYKNNPICVQKNMVLPVPCNQRMNSYLKEIADMCGITKKLTTHTARHSCATSVLIANGVPIETVSKILGHTNIRTTQIYARITDVKVSKDLEMLANILNKKSQ